MHDAGDSIYPFIVGANLVFAQIIQWVKTMRAITRIAPTALSSFVKEDKGGFPETLATV